MNRIIAAILLFAVSIGSGIGGYFTTLKYTDELMELMESDRNYVVSSGQISPDGAEKISTMWNKKQTLLAAVLPHDEIEDIEIGIMCMPDYRKQGLEEEYVEALNDCINRLKHIQDSEKPVIHNIF